MTKGTACEARMLAHATAFNWDAWNKRMDRQQAALKASNRRTLKILKEWEGIERV